MTAAAQQLPLATQLPNRVTTDEFTEEIDRIMTDGDTVHPHMGKAGHDSPATLFCEAMAELANDDALVTEWIVNGNAEPLRRAVLNSGFLRDRAIRNLKAVS